MPSSNDDTAVVRPWQVLAGSAAHASPGSAGADGARYALLVPGRVEQVVLSESGEALPMLATYTDHRRFTWRKFELPAADRPGRAPLTQTVVVKAHAEDAHAQTIRINLEGALARPVRGEDEPPTPQGPLAAAFDPHASAALWRQAAAATDGLIHRHLELVNRLYDDSRAEDGRMFWDNPGGGVGAWPLWRVIEAWREAGMADTAAHQRGDEAIVRLSRRLARLLNDVCHHPRHYLTRDRRVLAAERVREVDPACVRWLARQPGPAGRRLVDRVGAKRQAMAVVRYETADTVENRVVRDLIRRARAECLRVLERCGGRDDPGEAVVGELQAFTGLLDRLERDSPLADVPPTGSLPRPNHVLARDPRYRALWRAYMDLVKRQQQRDRTWRWRRRIWAESCLLGVLAAMQRLAPPSPAGRSPVLMRPGQQCGRYLDPRTAIGRFDLPQWGEGGASVIWLDAHQLAQYQSISTLPERLMRLCPDSALLLRDRRRPDQAPLRLLAIWAPLAFDIETDQLQKRTTELAVELRQIPGSTQVRGLLLQPNFNGEEDGDSDAGGDGHPNHGDGLDGQENGGDGGNGQSIPPWRPPQVNRPRPGRIGIESCLGLRLPMPVQRGEAMLERAIAEMLIQ